MIDRCTIDCKQIDVYIMADLTYSYVREPRNATSISISTLSNIAQTIACAEDFTLLYIYNLSS